MPSEFESLYEFHDEIDKNAQRLARIQPVGEFCGVAADGAIEVVVSAEGRVSKITVREGWRDAISPEDLGNKVVEAYYDATMAIAHDWGEAREDDEEEPDPDPAPVPPLSESFAAKLDSYVKGNPEQAEQAFGRLSEMLQGVIDGFDEAEQIIKTRITAEYEGSDPGGVVCVTLQGTGALVDVDIDLDWLENRHATKIDARLGEALAAAQRAMAEAIPAALLDGTPLAEAGVLLGDPDTLIRKISH
jgi:DNA-binding protein YbaB